MSGLEVNHRVWGAICVEVRGEAEGHVDIEGRALELGYNVDASCKNGVGSPTN